MRPPPHEPGRSAASATPPPDSSTRSASCTGRATRSSCGVPPLPPWFPAPLIRGCLDQAVRVRVRPHVISHVRDRPGLARGVHARSEEHTSELQSHLNIVCRLLLEKKK